MQSGCTRLSTHRTLEGLAGRVVIGRDTRHLNRDAVVVGHLKSHSTHYT